ncbi:MAG: drug/metabolite transporter (DMT)-like permease [Oleiphilaceae bacterium]|jgi:drug/metabolite transporter (DMT)-like permease
MKIVLYTTLALLAFAGNSILCRLALGENAIDAASFTAIRLLSGIIVLAIIIKMTSDRISSTSRGSWKASFMLFLYAVTFSYAYVSLETGVGALILFGAVQITMILVGLFSGNKLHYFEWAGVIVAFSGFVYLVIPGITAPPLLGFLLMSISGIAWGCYTLAGKGSANPLSDTYFNFLRSLPLVIILVIVTIQYSTMSKAGILLAMLSGGIASGVGYTIWYAALGGLSAIQAAVVQLLVPVLAAVGGVIFVDEAFSFRLVLAATIILGGVLVVITGKYFFERNIPKET